MYIYILQQGGYKTKSNIFVTTDIKEIAKEFSNIIKNGGYNLDKPYIQIWKDNTRKKMLLFSEEIEDEVLLLEKIKEKLANKNT